MKHGCGIVRLLLCHQAKKVYEKVGEATETALTVLVEKVNCLGIDKTGMKKKEAGVAVNHHLQVRPAPRHLFADICRH